ncbi:MAG: hypothetical protein R3B47_04110 [Bacteroidia bacterium]
MKHLFLPRVILLVSLLSAFAFAQAPCAVDTTAPLGTPGIYPDPLTAVPACQFADMDVTFVFPRDTTASGVTLPFLEFEILNVAGLPNGMSWECNLQPDCIYDLRSTNPNPDTVGCIRLFGTPSLPGTYPLTVQMNVTLPLVGTRPGTYDALLLVGPCKRNGSCYDLVLNTTCAPATLALTNQSPSNGKAGFTYNWMVTGPNGFNNQTNLENPPAATLSDPGQRL